MEKLQNRIKLGLVLLKEFDRLDFELKDQKFLEANDEEGIRFNHEILIEELEHFMKLARKYIESIAELSVNGEELYLRNSQHEDRRDYEIQNLRLRDFYALGLTINDVVSELDSRLKGFNIKKSDRYCKFIYDRDHEIIFENKIGENMGYKIQSREMKRSTICELVFKNKFNPVKAEDIEEERLNRLKKQGEYIGDDQESKDPYQWIRRSCDMMNKEIKEKFKIDYNLFETDPGTYSIRVNSRAKIKK